MTGSAGIGADCCTTVGSWGDIDNDGFEDFIATDLVYGDDGESIYGVPFATDTWAMVYNTDVMAEAGIDKVPETWDELLEASRKVKANTDKIGFGFAAGAPEKTLTDAASRPRPLLRTSRRYTENRTSSSGCYPASVAHTDDHYDADNHQQDAGAKLGQ